MQLQLRKNILTLDASGCHWWGPISSASLPWLGHFPSSRRVWDRDLDRSNHWKPFFPGQFSPSEPVSRYRSWETLSGGDGGYSDESSQDLGNPDFKTGWATRWLSEWQQQRDLWVSMFHARQRVNAYHPKNLLTACQSRSEQEVIHQWSGRREFLKTLSKQTPFPKKSMCVCAECKWWNK